MLGVLVAVHDGALGNVNADGSAVGEPEEKIYSQAGYLVLFADRSLVDGRPISLNMHAVAC